MKRFFGIFAIVLVLFFCLSVLPYAEGDETIESVDETVAESAAETVEETDEAAETEAVAETDEGTPVEKAKNWVQQIWTWFVENREVILTGVLNAITAGMVYVLKKLFDRDKITTKNRLEKIEESTTTTSKSQGDVVLAVNGMIDEYNKLQSETTELRLAYERQKEEYEKNAEAVGALFVSTTAIMEMLQSAYANSKNLPQPVKDMITYKYVHAMQTLDEKEKLKELAEQVKAKMASHEEQL